jgi:hypothetical protein
VARLFTCGVQMSIDGGRSVAWRSVWADWAVGASGAGDGPWGGWRVAEGVEEGQCCVEGERTYTPKVCAETSAETMQPAWSEWPLYVALSGTPGWFSELNSRQAPYQCQGQGG